MERAAAGASSCAALKYSSASEIRSIGLSGSTFAEAKGAILFELCDVVFECVVLLEMRGDGLEKREDGDAVGC